MIPLLPAESTLRRLVHLRLQWRVGAEQSGLGTRRTRRPGSSREFLGFRPYQTGDDVRDLDWAATSRFDRPWVRVYGQEVDAALLLLIDTSGSMAFGDPPKLAYAQALAGALGYLALAHHDRVGALAFTDAAAAHLPAERGRGQWAALRQLLGSLRPGGPTSLDQVPAALPRLKHLRGLAVLLSDFHAPEAFAAGLHRLVRGNLSAVAVHLWSPAELDPRLDGEVELVDLETGERRRGWIGADERAAYRAALARAGAQTAAICRESGIRYAPVATSMPVIRCLQQTLVRAGVLRRAGA